MNMIEAADAERDGDLPGYNGRDMGIFEGYGEFEEPAGTLGRVYGGDPRLLHIPDGTRANVARLAAALVEGQMRTVAENRTDREKETQPLCPGCYMVVGFDMLLVLADENGQSRTELARCMVNAFTKLLNNPDGGLTEEIDVLLDPPECS